MKQAAQVVANLQPALWARANRLHVCKIISEFTHELLLAPVLEYEEGGWGYYRLTAPGAPVATAALDTKESTSNPGTQSSDPITYTFRARILSLNHWYIDKSSLKKSSGAIDSLHFILEFKDLLNISTSQLPSYLEEITNTLYGSTYMMANHTHTSSDLVNAGYQTLEHAMNSGHPCFVANNGRIGFDANDYRAYAPEADAPIRLIWLAGHKSRTGYAAVDTLPYNLLMEKELGDRTLAAFDKVLKEKGVDPADYFFIPVHPWQWYNKLAMVFAPDIANNLLICLGEGPDDFSAQQSIRTFYNLSHPDKHYTKTAIGVLNMGFVRGLTPYYMDSTPPITEWIKSAIAADPYIQKLGFTLLCEVATVGYRNLYYEPFGKTSAYNKMLAALWRESPATVLQPGQQLMTMAALLHIDFNGNSLLQELIKAAGISTTDWLRKYLQAYLTPLLHCFYEHDLVFMPHGENLILVMENHIPVKAIMKDITEEIGVFSYKEEIPEKGRRICVTVPEELRALSILTDVFDCFFRFVGQILVEHCDYPEDKFWQLVAATIHAYQEDHPEHAEKFEQYDLFAEEFILSCLNRLQLRNNKQMVDLADPAGSLQLAGMLRNPIAVYKKANVSYSHA